MKDEVYKDLSNFCRWNDNNLVNKLLRENPDLDILYQEGRFLDFAIKHNNVKMLEELLAYFESTQLQGDSEELKYKVAKHKLQGILKDAVDTFKISQEIQVVLNQYIPQQDEDLEQAVNIDEEIKTLPIRKSYSMDDLKNNSNSKKSHSTHEHSDEELKALENSEFTKKLENDLFGYAKEVILDKPEMSIAGHLEDSTDHHSD
jgi:hypothetical protein